MPTLLLRNEQEILSILMRIVQRVDPVCITSLTILKENIRYLNELASMSDADSEHFLDVGAIALRLIGQFRGENKQESFNHIGFAKFLWGKHQKYGAEPLLEVGVLGITMRLISKINRAINMQTVNNNAYLPDEEDTLMDILGYCVLGYQLSRVTHD